MRDLLKPSMTLFIICIVVSASLAFTNAIAGPKVDERAAADAAEARQTVLPTAKTFEKVKDYDASANSETQEANVLEVYKGIKDGKFCGYVVSAESKGYAGNVKVIAGIDSDSKITGVKIIESSETPGLGLKASEEPFISQFQGFKSSEDLYVVKHEKTKGEEIEAISGATITSRAVVRAVQAAVDTSADLMRKGGN